MDPLIREMLRIRRFEEVVSRRYMSELEMRCPIHLCNGQEAVAVGVCSHLKENDWIFPPHRSHHWFLAKGGSMRGLAAEMYGKKTGCSGWAYTVDLAREVLDDDLVFEQDGVKVVVASDSISFLDGSTIDFKQEGLGSAFHFDNPNATEECGCGESFTIG